MVSLRGRLFFGGDFCAAEVEAPLPLHGGIVGLKEVFFLPLEEPEDMMKVMEQRHFSLKREDEAEKEGSQQMRKGLGAKFGVVFSFAVVVTGAELSVHQW